MATSVAFLGLGAMGAPMARRLVEANFDVAVWNRTASRAEPLAAAGAFAAATPAAAVHGRDVAVTMLRDAAAVREVIGSAAEALEPGATVVEMSTIGLAAVRELTAQLPAGVRLVDAPVLGSIPQAKEGSLRIFAGGDDEAVARVRPVLETLGTPVHVGPVGSGAAAKLVANSTLFATLAGLGEALALAEKLGLSREVAFDVLAATPLAEQAERRRPALDSGSYPPRFALSLARKDAELVAAADPELRVAAAARAWLTDADNADWGALDYSALVAWILGEPKPIG